MENRTYYPITSGQMVMYYSIRYMRKPQFVNICTMTHFEEDIEPEKMLEAIKLSLMRIKTCRTRIVKLKDRGLVQYFTDEEPQGIEQHDFSGRTEQEMYDYLNNESHKCFPNGSMDTQLYNVKLIKKPDGHYGIYFRNSHLILDAVGVMQWIYDVMSVYVALRDGTELPEDNNDPIPIFEREEKYQNGPRKQKDIDFLLREVLDTEPFYSSVAGHKFLKKGKRYGQTLSMFHAKAKHKNYVLDKEIVDAVNAFSEENAITPQSVYWLGIRNYLSKVCNKQEDITFRAMTAKRTSAKLRNAGGTMAGAVNVRLRVKSSDTFMEACRIAERQKFDIFKHGGLSTVEMEMTDSKKYKRPIGKGYITTGFTYQPYFVEKIDSLPVHFETLSNGVNAQQLYLIIMPLDYTGNLICNYDYNLHFIKEEEIDAMHQYLVWFLQNSIKNPDATLGELIDMKIKEKAKA